MALGSRWRSPFYSGRGVTSAKRYLSVLGSTEDSLRPCPREFVLSGAATGSGGLRFTGTLCETIPAGTELAIAGGDGQPILREKLKDKTGK
jgi:hypothetical protein